MKKLFTLAAFAATMCFSASAYAPGVDTFDSYAMVGAGASAGARWSGEVKGGATDVVYNVTEVQPTGSDYFYMFGGASIISFEAKNGEINLTNIKRDGGPDATFVEVYTSDKPITINNYFSATLLGNSPWGGNLVVNPDECKQYVAVYMTDFDGYSIDGLKFTFEEAAGGGDEPVTPPAGDFVAGTDRFTTATINPDGENRDLITGEFKDVTGISYDFYKVMQWYDGMILSEGNEAYICMPAAAGDLRMTKFTVSQSSAGVQVYGGNAPMTYADRSSATDLGTVAYDWRLDTSTFTVPEGYDYIMLCCKADEGEVSFNDFTATWESGAPVVGGGMTDKFTYAGLAAQNPDANTSADSYSESDATNAELHFTGETGVEYGLMGVNLCGDRSVFAFPYDYTKGYGIYTITPAENRWIKSVTVNHSYSSSDQLTVYHSNAPFTFEERNDVDSKRTYASGSTTTIEFEEPATCVYVCMTQLYITDLTIEYTDVKPVPTVATPVIECYSDPVIAGSNASVKTATIGAEIEIRTQVNGQFTGETINWKQDEEWSSATVTLPGKTGDMVTIFATASKEGWTDSETAMKSWTLAKPYCPEAKINGSRNLNYLLAGQELTISVTDNEGNDIEGAEVTYTWEWNNWDTNTNGSSDEAVTAAAPCKFTVPADVPVGAYFQLYITTSAPGYQDYTPNYGSGANIISPKLNAPTLSVANDTEVRPGTELSLYRPERATTIHYTVNGGEEQTAEEYSATIVANEELNIVAWASGDAPFEDSEKVEFHVTVEKIDKNVDVFYPEISQDYKAANHFFTGTEHNGGNEYLYKGGWWNKGDGNDTFHDLKFFTNLTAGEYTITGVRIDVLPTSGQLTNIYVADEPMASAEEGIFERYDDNFNNFEESLFFFMGDPNEIDEINRSAAPYCGDYNDWIKIEDVQAKALDEGYIDEGDDISFLDKKYILIRQFKRSMSFNQATRIMIMYSSPSTSVSEIDADNTDAEAVYYNLNGVRVDGNNLTPGLYIRVCGTKADKIVVK